MTDLAQATCTPSRLACTPHLPELRAALRQQRRFRVEQLEELDATAPTGPASAAEDSRTEVSRLLREAAMAALADIDAALNRIRRNLYGRCESCDTPIGLERLEILPAVRLCMPCQSAQESGKLMDGHGR
ncbi:MAG: TraR/DksA family transcriptional regulator [Nocardioidaceae bacterium]